MSDFKTKMHKVGFPPGLCLRPHWGHIYSAPPDPVAVFKGAYLIIIINIHEYYYGGAVALLLQDHLTMSVSRFAD